MHLSGAPTSDWRCSATATRKLWRRAGSSSTKRRINIQLETTDKDKLFINAVVSADGHDAEATIRGGHTNFVFLRRDADVLLDRKGCEVAAIENGGVELTLRKVYDFAMQTDVDDLRFILDARRLNEAAANEGLRENYGHELGKTLCSPLGKGIMGDSIFSHILAGRAAPATRAWPGR